MREIIYVLENPGMPGMVKLGRTRDLEQRLRDLHSTGVAYPFRVVCWVDVDESLGLEAQLHLLLDPWRVNGRREFFALPAHQAQALVLRTAGAMASRASPEAWSTPR